MRTLFTLRHGAQAWCPSSRWPHRSSWSWSWSKCILRSIGGRHLLCNVTRSCAGNRSSAPIPTERYEIVVVVSADPHPIGRLTISGLASIYCSHSDASASSRTQSRCRRLAVIAKPVGICVEYVLLISTLMEERPLAAIAVGHRWEHTEPSLAFPPQLAL